MKKNNCFLKFFMDGFTGKLEFYARSDSSKTFKYLDKAFFLLENSFKKVSKQDETEEKLLYKK